jgi:hypothetical protein
MSARVIALVLTESDLVERAFVRGVTKEEFTKAFPDRITSCAARAAVWRIQSAACRAQSRNCIGSGRSRHRAGRVRIADQKAVASKSED